MSNEEEKLQAQCTQWFWNEFPSERRMLFHVDNNSYNKVIGAKKKALGVVQGVSDLVFVCGTVIFIEIKTDIGEQTPEQRDFAQKVSLRGHVYRIIRSFEEFKIFITKQIANYERLH